MCSKGEQMNNFFMVLNMIFGIVLAIVIICLAALVVYSLLEVFRDDDDPEVIGTCPKCNTTQIKGYTLMRPRSGRCPKCGEKVKFHKV